MHSSFLHKFLVSFFPIAFALGSTSVFAQEAKLSEIKKSYSDHYKQNLEEKLYVHTDQNAYLCGEILWFKTYLVSAVNHQFLPVSKIAYVEVLDKLNRPVLQGKISIKDAMGNGSFYIPHTIASGNYLLRAYTNWMKNFSPEGYFEKIITIVNTSNKQDSSIIREKNSYAADFFPEGGNLVNGLESVIAFKVNDSKNKGVQCNGAVVDQLNDTVARFSSLKLGMGAFLLKPDIGKNYTAIINLENGSVIKKNLPKVYESGYVMHVSDNAFNHLKLSVQAKVAAEANLQGLFAIIENHGRISFAKFKEIENGKADFVISKDSLKEGISQITVFNYNKQPVCERLYFKRPQNKMQVKIKTDKEDYALRNKISMNVSTGNEVGAPLPANLSMSIYRLDNLSKTTQENIFSYLWLSSGLKGTIENPDYYFENQNAETDSALDLLMLSQGWRAFDWESILGSQKPSFAFVPEYKGHIITGRLIDIDTKKPITGANVCLSVPGKRVQLQACVSDSGGLVHFDMKDFFDAKQIVMQTNGRNETRCQFEVFSPFSEKYSNTRLAVLTLDSMETSDLASAHISAEVQNAYHQIQLNQTRQPSIDSLPFYYRPFKTYELDDYKRFTTMEEVMREFVTEVSVRKQGGKFRFMTFNDPAFKLTNFQMTQTVFDNNPLVLLDGTPVFDINKIVSYDPLKVKKVEVVAERYHFGSLTSDGIVSYTTYKGNLEGFTLDPNDLVLDYEGLQKQRIFYSPQYDSDDARQNRLPDFRRVLFWKPDVSTDGNGKGALSFYTGDVPGQYLIIAEGLSASGAAGSNSIIFSVK